MSISSSMSVADDGTDGAVDVAEPGRVIGVLGRLEDGEGSPDKG